MDEEQGRGSGRNRGQDTSIALGGTLKREKVENMLAKMNSQMCFVVKIENCLTTSLVDPLCHIVYGKSVTPLPAIIPKRTQDAASFSKVGKSVAGAVCVFSYKVQDNERFAVMVDIPYALWYGNWLATAILKNDETVDKELYKHMYEDDEYCNRERRQRVKAKNGTIVIHANNYTVTASMTDSNNAIVDVRIEHKKV